MRWVGLKKKKVSRHRFNVNRNRNCRKTGLHSHYSSREALQLYQNISQHHAGITHIICDGSYSFHESDRNQALTDSLILSNHT